MNATTRILELLAGEPDGVSFADLLEALPAENELSLRGLLTTSRSRTCWTFEAGVARITDHGREQLAGRRALAARQAKTISDIWDAVFILGKRVRRW